MDKNTRDKISTDFLWKIMARYDLYYSGANSKGALLLTFNTFVLGSFIIKLDDIIKAYQVSVWAKYIFIFLLLVIFVANIYSIWKVLGAINPFLSSPKWPEKYHSKIYFGHVSEYKDEEHYHDTLREMDEGSSLRDISYQLYALSKGLSAKYSNFKHATRGAVIQIIAILGLGILRVVIVIKDLF